VFDEATAQHLHAGCALLIGTVSADGRPHAGRGHGVRVLEGSPTRVRLLLSADDHVMHDNLRTTGRIAITTADVASLHSIQLKGRAGPLEPPTDDDCATAARYTDQFLTDIVRVDRYARPILEGWAHTTYLACTVLVEDVFDQTPGPSAGAARAADA
jgi:hypothetical protein